MPNEHNSPKRYDYLDKLETGEKIGQELLDAIEAKNSELAEILETSNLLRDTIKVKPSAKFTRSSQVRIFYRVVEPRTKKISTLDTIKNFFSNLTVQKPLKLSPVLTSILVIILSFSVMVGGVQASDAAGPGDLLYPVDLALEDAQLFFAHSEENRLKLRAGFAQERLEEAQEAYEEEDQENAELALANFESQMLEISGLQVTQGDIPEEILLILAESDKTNTEVLANLLDQVPESAHDAILHAIEVSSSVLNEGTPPGQEDKDTPPGLDDESIPPGQEDKDTPPGQEDKDTPPGQEDKDTPPGLEDKDTPPGLEDKDTPPGLEDKDKG